MEGYDTNYEAFGELIREGHTYRKPRIGRFQFTWYGGVSANFHSQLAETVLF
jgi:hypothetical protein